MKSQMKSHFLLSIKINGINFFLKYRLFQNVKELSKSNQIWCVSPTMYVDCKRENHLAVACLEKNSEFRLVIVVNKRIIFFKYSLFQNVMELSKSNQNWCVSPTLYVDCKSENHLAVACLEKNSEFRLLIVANKRIIFFKYSLFQNVKELFKSNKTHS